MWKTSKLLANKKDIYTQKAKKDVMNVIEKRNKLEQTRIQIHLKKKRNEMYERLLIVLGTVSVLIATMLLLLTDLFGQGMGLLVIGIALVLMGSIWQHKEEREMTKIEEDLQHCKEEELAGIHDISEY